MEKQRIEAVYNDYALSGKKAAAWQSSRGKDLAWKEIFSIIKKEIHNRYNETQRLQVLDIGCYSGGILKRISSLIPSAALVGVDVRAGPLTAGKQNHPQTHFLCADGMNLPFKNASFDIIMQFVCLSSIPDINLRGKIYLESYNSLKPGGTFISMDMRYRSPNPNVVPISKTELKSHFPHASYIAFYPVWLLPPLQRSISSLILLKFFHAFPFLRSHWLCFVRK
jgi:SAM-dependent methyltransferase